MWGLLQGWQSTHCLVTTTWSEPSSYIMHHLHLLPNISMPFPATEPTLTLTSCQVLAGLTDGTARVFVISSGRLVAELDCKGEVRLLQELFTFLPSPQPAVSGETWGRRQWPPSPPPGSLLSGTRTVSP